MPKQEEQPVASEPAPATVMENVVITVQSISRGDMITEEMVGTAPYPQEYMVEGLFFTDVADVVGRYAKVDMDQGRFLTQADLYEKGEGSFASFEIPEGMVAITIPIPSERYLVSYAIRSGDFINILATIKMVDLDQEFQTILPNSVATLFKREVVYQEGVPTNFDADLTLRVDGSDYMGRIYQDPSIPNEYFYVVPTEPQRPRLVTQSVFQNVKVLWVGDLPLEAEEAAAAQAAATQNTEEGEQTEAPAPEVIKPTRITVALSEQDALALNYLMLTQADLNLVLRSAGDNQVVQTEPVTLQFIMDQYNIPYPTKLPYGIDMSV
ncbi:MAG: SAF domain-containing protein, partial [Anaerolineaceae bacterium]